MYRRTVGGCLEVKRMADEIYRKYAARMEPGAHEGDEHLRLKAQAGEPTAPERSRLRRQCKPHGPVGLQGSLMCRNGCIVKWNQPPIHAIETPFQHLRPSIRQAAARNCTLAAEGGRKETQGLKEINMAATKGECRKMEASDLNLLNIIRTVSTWTKEATFWTGRKEENVCALCGKEVETPEHMLWKCECLEEARKI